MSFKTEIAMNYEDKTGLVCNRPCLHTDLNPSGNGVCYLGEFMSILQQRGELDQSDRAYFYAVMRQCFVQPGLLCRGPGQPDIEGPDDYYGFAAGCTATGETSLPEEVIAYGWKHWGSFNNVLPGAWSWASFLWRQPQLIAALYAAARRTPLWIYPLRVYAALIIATSCMFSPTSDTDARRLSWLLIQTLSPVSWLCRHAARRWQKRLLKDYGLLGMKAVSNAYFSPTHPFSVYRLLY